MWRCKHHYVLMTLYKSLPHNGAYNPTMCTNRLIFSKWTFFNLSFLDLSHNYTNLVLWRHHFSICLFFTVVISSDFSSWMFDALRYKCGNYTVYFLVFESLLSLLFHWQHFVPWYSFHSTSRSWNWTKGKLLGAGAFGQVRCKLAWASFKLCPI